MYNKLRDDIDRAMTRLPGVIGSHFRTLFSATEKAVKGVLKPGRFFEDLGVRYFGPIDGHDIGELIAILERVKVIPGPCLIQVVTEKGRGMDLAEKNPSKWHASVPFNPESGLPLSCAKSNPSLTCIFGNTLLDLAKKDNRIIGITGAMANGCGLDIVAKELPNQVIDVGIAEEHAVAFASAMAKNKTKPVIAMHSSFIQRTYDQLSHDLAINKNPAVILIFGNGISSMDETHLGTFDMSMISNIPNIIFLSPTCKNEYLSQLDWAIEQDTSPVIIRVPNNQAIDLDIKIKSDYSDLSYLVEKQGEKVAVLAMGSLYNLGEEVINSLKEKNIDATLINPIYASSIDKKVLNNLKENHSLVITLEDGILDGGFGEKVTRYYSTSNMKVINYGASKEFTDSIQINELYDKYRLNVNNIVEDILKNI